MPAEWVIKNLGCGAIAYHSSLATHHPRERSLCSTSRPLTVAKLASSHLKIQPHSLHLPSCTTRCACYGACSGRLSLTHSQLNQIFPHLGRNFYLKQLLFSADGSDARILIGREVHDAKEYSQRLANPSIGGPWSSPLLKFDVFDDTPAGSEREHPYGFIPWRTPPALPPLAPLHHISLPMFPHPGQSNGHGHGPMPPPPPPPPMHFHSPGMGRPMDTDKAPHHFMPPPMPPPMWPHHHSFTPQSQSPSTCCSVSAAKQDVCRLISDFKKDLDDVVADLSPSPAGSPSNQKCAQCDLQSLAALPACISCSASLVRFCLRQCVTPIDDSL